MVELKGVRNGKSISTYGRKKAEIELVNAHTKAQITGKTTDGKIISQTDFITLQCIKDKLLNTEKNPFGLHPKPHANAHIQKDMRIICINGFDIDGVKQQLKCKEYGDRVIFINPQLARELIAKEKVKDTKEEMTERLKFILTLKDRDGYIPA